MNTFRKISIINNIDLLKPIKAELQKYSENPIVFVDDDSQSEEETIKRIGDADAALGSWNTTITPKILDSCPSLKYLGICGTSLTYVDLGSAKSHGVTVKNVTDYGDEATAEFIFTRLLMLIRGFDKYSWDLSPRELCGKTLGIIGLGAVGKHVARIGLGFGMKVVYFSRNQNDEYEAKGLVYKSLNDLLVESDFISLHVPRNLKILGDKEFKLIKPKTVLINTAIGEVFDMPSFKTWINKEQNIAIIDNQSYISEIQNLPNVITLPITAGKTQESTERLANKVLQNIQNYLNN